MGEVINFPASRFKGFLTKREIARALGRSPRWVELQMRDGGLPHTRDGRGYARFDLAAVNEWQERRMAS